MTTEPHPAGTTDSEPTAAPARSADCQCAVNHLNRAAWAGPALALCHHSSPALAQEIQDKLLDLCGDFAQQIDPEDLFQSTVADLAKSYREQVAGKLEHLLSEEERNVINIQFMRNYSLTVMALTCAMIIARERYQA